MTVIKAPYNFVPFNKEVVTPHWIDQISHDIPFKDGLSGKIEVKLTAMSPIFVRDGIGQASSARNYKDGVQQEAHTFSQAPDGRYFIPGTSLKGMIRSVLEILSFGRMEGKVNDHRYALRDLSGAMKSQYLSQFNPEKIRCGWLRKNDDNTYSIKDCGMPGRIGHDEIDKLSKNKFVTYFGERGGFNARRDSDKAAQKKYRLFGDPELLRNKFSQTEFPVGVVDGGRTLYKIDQAGNKTGTLVFTGQPGVRKRDRKGKLTGHFYEFIFFEDSIITHQVDEKVIEAFFFAYYEHDRAKWSEDWKVWRQRLEKEKEEIPVFFHLEKDNKIAHLGLSYLYKLPYTNSVLESIIHHQGKGKQDLSEAIFGYVIDGKEQLRGRVHIGHAFSNNAKPTDHDVSEVLSGPKASYFPTYIRQAVRGDGAVDKYSTFMDIGAEIAGWKRYPVHIAGVKHNNPPDGTDSEKIITKFRPLDTGAEFVFILRYHNLRPMELGALISALTFHNAPNTFHSIGMAKPLGYGKLKVEILNMDEEERKKYLQIFEAYMNAQPNMPYDSRWNESTQVVELITMSRCYEEVDLAYMPLKDHLVAKNKKDEEYNDKPYEALAPYSQLVKAKAAVPSYCEVQSIEAMRSLLQVETRGGNHQSNIEEVIATEFRVVRRKVEENFGKLRQFLLHQLSERKNAILTQEHDAKLRDVKIKEDLAREFKRKGYLAGGPDIDTLEAGKSDSFAKLITEMENFGRFYYNQSSNEIRSNDLHPNGFLPVKFHKKLWDWLDRFVETGLSRRDRTQWIQKGLNHGDIKRLTQWVGEEKTRDFLQKL